MFMQVFSEMSTHLQKKIKFYLRFVLFIVTIYFLSLVLFKQATVYPLHEDELVFTRRAVFADWFAAGSFGRSEWLTYESYDVPKFAELFYGFVIKGIFKRSSNDYLTGIGFLDPMTGLNLVTVEEITIDCCFYKDLPEGIRDKTQVIIFLRQVSISIFVIPLLIILFLIGLKTKGFTFGYIIMLLIGSNTLFISTMTKAMGDAQLWFFNILFVLLTLLFFNSIKLKLIKDFPCYFTPFKLFFLTVLGICAGLATASKLNGVITLIFFVLVYCCYCISAGVRKFFLVAALHSTVVVCVAYLTFFILNPFLWSNPISNTLFMAHHREEIISQQKKGSPTDRVVGFPEKISAIYELTLSADSEYSFFRFGELNNKTYFFPLHFVLDDQKFIFPLDILLVMSSIVLLFLNRESHTDAFKIVLFFIAVFTFITTLFLPLKWERYFLPYMFSWGFLQAYVLTLIIQKLLFEDASAKK